MEAITRKNKDLAEGGPRGGEKGGLEKERIAIKGGVTLKILFNSIHI